MSGIYAKCGDTFFTRSNSLLGKMIRWAESDPGEEPVWANHTGVVVEDGYIGEGQPQAIVVEALWKTRRGPLRVNGIKARVFRPRELTLQEKHRFRTEAEKYVGDTYGYWKLAFHLADRLLFKGKKVLSSLMFLESRPICSFLAAHVNESIGITFGMDPDVADPDEMMDWCEAHPVEFEEVK